MTESESLTWQEGLQKFIEYSSTEESDYELSPNTIKTYKYQLLLFGKAITLKKLKDITQEDVINYVQHMRRKRRKESYVHVAVSSLRAAFRFWKELGYSGNPIENYHFRISSKRGRRRDKRDRKTKSLSVEQIKALFQAIESEIIKLSSSNDKEPLVKLFRAWLIIAVFYSTGLRKGELLQITPDKVSYDQRTFYIVRKGHIKPSYVMVTELLKNVYPNEDPKEDYPDVLEKVKEYIAYRDLKKDDPLFDISERTVGRHIDYWTKKAQIAEKVYPHRFRHTFGTHMAALNISEIIIQNLMDHKDPNTSRIYITTVPEQDAGVLNRLGLFKGNIEPNDLEQNE